MTYIMKYEPRVYDQSTKLRRTRKQRPETWISGPDLVDHDKYYAWQKHKAQARFRGEEYALTWEDFQTIWPNELFVQRGRTRGCYSMIRLDTSKAWDISNVEVVPSEYHHKTQKERLV